MHRNDRPRALAVPFLILSALAPSGCGTAARRKETARREPVGAAQATGQRLGLKGAAERGRPKAEGAARGRHGRKQKGRPEAAPVGRTILQGGNELTLPRFRSGGCDGNDTETDRVR